MPFTTADRHELWDVDVVFKQLVGKDVTGLATLDPDVAYSLHYKRGGKPHHIGDTPLADISENSVTWHHAHHFQCNIGVDANGAMERKLLKIQLMQHVGKRRRPLAVGPGISVDLAKYLDSQEQYAFPFTILNHNTCQLHLGITARPTPQRPTEGDVADSVASDDDRLTVVSAVSHVSRGSGAPKSPMATRDVLASSASEDDLPSFNRQRTPSSSVTSRHRRPAERSRSRSNPRRPEFDNDSLDARSVGTDAHSVGRRTPPAAGRTEMDTMAEEVIVRLQSRVDELQRALGKARVELGDERRRRQELETGRGKSASGSVVASLKGENQRYRELLEREKQHKERLQEEWNRKSDEFHQLVIEQQDYYERAQRQLARERARTQQPQETCADCVVQ